MAAVTLRRNQLAYLVTILTLLVASLGGTSFGVKAASNGCKAKTTIPSTNTPAPSDIGGDDDAKPPSVPTTTRPKKSKAPRTSKPSVVPATAYPAPTTPASDNADDVTDAPSPASSSTNATITSRPSAGKCVTGDPTKYISKAYVDWIWEKRMKPDFNSKIFIYDQLMTNKGKLNYCVRWDSTNKLTKANASKFTAMLQRQYDQWIKWLVGYGCWPYDKIQVEIVAFAVRDRKLLEWSDDSLGAIYENILDNDGKPMCPDACYKHRDNLPTADISGCKGKGFDMSLWPTLNLGGGFGYDWGQQVDEANMLSSLDSESSVIVAHEIGHGFGLPDFYKEEDKPGKDMPKLIMEAGASMSVTEGDGWLLRRGWEHARLRYASTSG